MKFWNGGKRFVIISDWSLIDISVEKSRQRFLLTKFYIIHCILFLNLEEYSSITIQYMLIFKKPIVTEIKVTIRIWQKNIRYLIQINHIFIFYKTHCIKFYVKLFFFNLLIETNNIFVDGNQSLHHYASMNQYTFKSFFVSQIKFELLPFIINT